eukprot:9478903-Pyramimonas_sp.AAC.2
MISTHTQPVLAQHPLRSSPARCQAHADSRDVISRVTPRIRLRPCSLRETGSRVAGMCPIVLMGMCARSHEIGLAREASPLGACVPLMSPALARGS